MAVEEINSTNSVLSAGSQIRSRTSTPQAATPDVTPPAPAAVVAAQELTPAQEAARLVNEALRELNFVSAPRTDVLLVNEANAIVEEIVGAQELTPAQQAALAINQTLQVLNFEPLTPTDVLLINETNPALDTVLESENLTPAQQAALAVNEILDEQTAPRIVPEIVIPATAGEAVIQVLAAGQVGAAPVEEAVAAAAGVVTAVETGEAGIAAAAVAAPAPTPTPVVTETTVVPEVPNLTQANVIPPVVDRNVIATPVYEVRDPHPVPPEPAPVRPDLMPMLPIGRARPVDPLVLRREWERRRERGRGEGGEILPRPPLAERSIREMVGRTNEDLSARGLPLRLVLAKTSEGYSLDIYDCSDEGACHLSQEVHLDLSELLTILDNIQHESGIIVNIKT